MIQEKLLAIQIALKAPKDNYNAFGKYKYRSCEDIVESVKPILNEVGCTLTLSDELVNIGERYYIKATAILKHKEETENAVGYAREAETQKGFDQMQLTGSTSSYARKYALNGLFLIDDSKDSDVTNTHGKEPVEKPKEKKYKEDVCAKEETIKKESLKEMLPECATVQETIDIWWLLTKKQQEDVEIKGWFSARKSQLNDEGIYG